MIFASTYKSKTVPVALADMAGKYQIRYGDMTAGAVIAAILPGALKGNRGEEKHEYYHTGRPVQLV